MIVLGIDTATPSTCVGLITADGRETEARDDPPEGARPNHTRELLGLARQLLGQAGLGWGDVERVAVGRGPGTFTGLRIGVATARSLAQSSGAELVGVSTLAALALAAQAGRQRPILSTLDARRGEVYIAAYEGDSVLLAPCARAPEAAAEAAAAVHVQTGQPPLLAVGDGAVRFRMILQAAGVQIPPDESPLHRVSAAAICRLGASVTVTGDSQATVVPEYLRLPDAEIARRSASRTGQSLRPPPAAAQHDPT